MYTPIRCAVPAMFAAGLVLAAPPAGATSLAATPSLSAAGSLPSGLSMQVQVRPGPYFAGEVLSASVALKNASHKTFFVQQPSLCQISAQVTVAGHAVSTPALPPAPLCQGTTLPLRSLAPGAQISGGAMVVIPLISGKAGTTFKASLRATVSLTVSGFPKATNPTIQSGPVSIAVAPVKATTGGSPTQTLKLGLSRDAQGFIVAVSDGRNKPVSGVAGWYVVQAPDGPLAWGVAAPGRVYCGGGCATGPAKGTYRLSVTMLKDGYSLANSTLTYTVK